MSRNSDRRPGKGAPRIKTSNPESTDRLQDAEHEVGYGKPPKHTRFVKGQSGNPRGRPRKPKPRPPRLSDALSDKFLEEEAYRSVALRENGKGIKLPATQAVLRALVMGAIKGNRLSQKYFLEHVAREEERNLEYKVARYTRMEALKRTGEQKLAGHRRRGLPPPDLLPHPEDIVLNPVTCEAYVSGPETPEEVHFHKHIVQLRDHVLLRSAHDSERPEKASAKLKDDAICTYMVLAQLLNQSLARRYRWLDNAEFHLFIEYQFMPRRKREQRIAAEFAQLQATRPRPLHITPEEEWEMDRIFRKNFAKGARPSPS